MKTFFKDYVALCKASCVFMRKHWLGLVITYVVSFAAALAWLCRDEIFDKVKGFFGKKDEKEEDDFEDLFESVRKSTAICGQMMDDDFE